MNSSEGKDYTPVYVLLPCCKESATNVFFSILKNIIARKKLIDNDYEMAVSTGMTLEQFSIDIKDITLNWENLRSKSQQLRQAKLLGFWSINNYRTLGKTFFGKMWQAPERHDLSVKLENGSRVITGCEIDAIMAPKMKCQVIELTVSRSTTDKLVNFVKVPISGIRLNNMNQLSAKVKSYDVDDLYLEKCWQSLKFGKWCETDLEHQMDSNQPALPRVIIEKVRFDCRNHVNVSQKRKTSEERYDGYYMSNLNTQAKSSGFGETSTGEESSTISDDNDIPMNLCIRSLDGKRIDCRTVVQTIYSESDSESFEEIRELETEVGNNQQNEDFCLTPAKRVRLDTEDRNSNICADHQLDLQNNLVGANDFQTILLGMREDIRNLTKWLDPSVVAANVDELKRKDNEIAEVQKIMLQMEGKSKKLEEELDMWKKHASNKEKEIKDIALSEEKMKFQMVEKEVKLVEELKGWKTCATEKDKELEDTKKALIEEKMKLKDAEKFKVEMMEKEVKLVEELNGLKTYAAQKEKEIENTKEALSGEKMKLNNAEKLSLEMMKKEVKLVEELKEWQTNAAQKEKELEDTKKALSEEKMKLKDVEKFKVEMMEKEVKLVQELNGWTTYAAQREKEVEDTKEALSGEKMKLNNAEKLSLEMVKKEVKLVEELKEWQTYAAQKEKELKDTREELSGEKMKSDYAEKIRLEMVEKEVKLLKELNGWKTYASEKDKDLEDTNEALSEEKIKSDDREKMKLETMKISAAEKETGFQSLSADNENESEEFETDDPIVKECRDKLLALQFGWIKFQTSKNCKWVPGFIHLPDEDGISRGQSVTSNGYVSNIKNIFFQFDKNIPDENKLKPELAALKKLNKKFKFAYV